jgi:hypothetical protein
VRFRPTLVEGYSPPMGTCRPFILASGSAVEKCSRGIHDDPALPYDSVVVAFAPAWLDYAVLNTAFRILMNERPAQHG